MLDITQDDCYTVTPSHLWFSQEDQAVLHEIFEHTKSIDGLLDSKETERMLRERYGDDYYGAESLPDYVKNEADKYQGVIATHFWAPDPYAWTQTHKDKVMHMIGDKGYSIEELGPSGANILYYPPNTTIPKHTDQTAIRGCCVSFSMWSEQTPCNFYTSYDDVEPVFQAYQDTPVLLNTNQIHNVTTDKERLVFQIVYKEDYYTVKKALDI